MGKLTDTQTKLKANIKVADIFAAKYDSKLPEDITISFGCYEFGINLTFILDYYSDEQRDQALTLIGDVFGRGGWMSELGYQGTCYNWTQTIDDVAVKIQCAQKLNRPNTFPVDPKQFPLQLQSAA